MSALFSSLNGGIPGMASSSSSGPASGSNNIFVGADGGSTTSLARILNITSGAPLNGGFTGEIFPSEQEMYVSGIRRTTETTNNTPLIIGAIALVLVAVIIFRKG